MLRYLTAGESHGKALVAIIEGMPAGLRLNLGFINRELKRRQQGYGRGQRMHLEEDTASIISGLRKGMTLGSPITIMIENKDASIEELPEVFSPRPGHADLAGVLKYGFSDIRNVLERASARETAIRVGVGALCKILLKEFSIEIVSQVCSVGGETSKSGMLRKIAEAMNRRDTVGGVFKVVVKGVPVGLGSYVQWDKRLDGSIAQEIIAIPGVKAVEIGLGFGYAEKLGSEVHDAIYYTKGTGFYRKTNNAGGIEGGISNGQDIVITGCMKPICTLMNPLPSVDILTKKPSKAATERSDVSVVEATGVIAEAVIAFELSKALLDKFGADNLSEIKKSFNEYVRRIRQ